MYKVCVLTAIRSEYGLLRNLIKKLNKDDYIDLRVVVTGAHLSSEFGYTYKEIEQDGILIDKKIKIPLDTNSSIGISNAISSTIISFTEYFNKEKFDLLIVLGDRYETFAVTIAAMNEKLPIAHLHGGELTAGAIDESIRHAITKMSYIHFPSTEEYRKRIIQLGENPDRVFNVGALGVENIKDLTFKSKQDLETKFNIDLKDKYAVLIYHPVTLSNINIEVQLKELLNGIKESLNNYQLKYVILGANADKDGLEINKIFKEFTEENKNKVYFFTSLNVEEYLSLLKYSEFVIGNSSSGILEAPSFNMPTINIGDRQRGRISAKSVINIDLNKDLIIQSINKCLYNKDFKDLVQNVENPYDKDGTSDNIVRIIKDILKSGNIDLKKDFYDLK